MAKRAVLVKDGIAYNYRGERLAPVVAADGYYTDVVPNIGLEDGEWMKGVPIPNLESRINDGLLVECYTLSDYPALVRVDYSGQRVEGGRISPALPIGSLIYIFDTSRDAYYYLPPERQISNLADLLARWWLRFPFESPWERLRGRGDLIKARRVWAKSTGCSSLEHIVFQAYRDFMSQPSDLSVAVGPLVRRQLGFIRHKLNLQISSMGGEVTRILPIWQKGIALCHAWFTINGIDPTSGAGCDVYKNGDFYYGPWCQRIRQKTADNKIMLLHDFPPKYTLRSWIAGPLYATAQEHGNKKGDNGFPRKFNPTGVATLLTGTDVSGKSDLPENIIQIGQDELEKGIEKAVLELRAEEVARIGAAVSGSAVTVSENTGEPILRLHVYGGAYLRSGNARDWLYCVPLVGENLQEFEFTIEVLDGDWGTSKPRSAFEYSGLVPSAGCNCVGCLRIRKRVKKCLNVEKMPETEQPTPF